ncbi:MAG: pyrimidine reductase family protein [Microbacterium sp.]
MSARIDRLWPEPAEDLDDERIVATYAFPDDKAWLRVNFVSSLDGAATRDGRSGGLGDDADHRVFDLLRRPADVVLVGAGTVRTEGYGAMTLDDAAVAWRRERGLPPQPVFALVSRRLDLEPGSAVFADAPVRPVVYTVAAADADRRAALSEAADVVDAGQTEVDLTAVKQDLAGRGLARIHSEGGPTLFGALIAQGAVDELCVTAAPSLEGGDAPRIAVGSPARPTDMALAAVLRGGDELLLRYTRP